ncbi:MaoC family dehydratase [Spirillospora sp. CA-255316]
MRHIHGIDGLRALVGQRIGDSDRVHLDQVAIDSFADLSHDHNWIHVDPDKARSSPFGSTIAHGLHALALVGGLMQQIFVVEDIGMVLAYGLDKVRFPQAVPVDSKVRLSVDLVALTDARTGGEAVDAVWHCLVQADGFTKPACVADMLMRYFPPNPT